MNTFLGQLQAGWGVALLGGLVITLQISIGGYITGLAIGGLVAWTKLRGLRWAVLLANAYSTICRAVPEVLLILILFYAGQTALNALMDRLGWSTVDISGKFAAIAVLGIVLGAYASEILRGAVLALPKGQIEAARAYGLHGFSLFRRIILPLIVPYALPGLTNLWMSILKDSALIFAVGYSELTFTAMQAAGSTKLYFPFLMLCGAMYYVVTQVSNIFFKAIEARIRRWMPRLG
ncbi:polar amino acid transport system permease protein [Labrys monachus]|uniref:Polar amino acid transport system permease protein n=1 Tax=Labrys monachus TaxID=217067 RepID=A0ABU0FIU0_9HYPH|nr:ABC transporter permease subunit [Labrys monachus]MDQ0393975.1 polar amino acid transport system permease protein [Labrys monachus]